MDNRRWILPLKKIDCHFVLRGNHRIKNRNLEVLWKLIFSEMTEAECDPETNATKRALCMGSNRKWRI